MASTQSTEDPSDQLQSRRELVTQLLEIPGKEGDHWNLIHKQYLEVFLYHEVESFAELQETLGPVAVEPLYADGVISDDGTFINPIVYQHFVNWFGIDGQSIARALFVDENGNIVVEKYPPYFLFHILTKQVKHEIRAPGFQLSKVATFKDLVDALKNEHLKAPNFRVWFATGEELNDAGRQIAISTFLGLPFQKLLQKSMLDETLASQNFNQSSNYHLVIEVNGVLGTHLNQTNLQNFDFQKKLLSGGNLGLVNLGNTCYMNSALQCLVHVPEINFYFFLDLFTKELNKSNPLGYGGYMAQIFGSLLHKLFDNEGTSGSISPREFKFTIGHYSSMFYGYQQQDSQEFLSWLLDSLHEDLNRIYDKPYLEKPELKDEEINDKEAIKRLAEISWDQYKKRNDSIIIDLFSGLYQSTLVCPDCGKTSITYDPFNDLTLPLPIDKKWYHTFTLVNLSEDVDERILKFQVELNKTSNFDDLLNYLANFLKVPKEFIFIYELFRDYVYQDFQSNNKKYKFIPISELINSADNIVVYIIPHDDDDIIVPVLNTVHEDKSYKVTNTFGVPLFVTLKPSETKSFGTIRLKLEDLCQILTKEPLTWHSEKEDDGYDSDVSLADSEVNADYGFTIKAHEDTRFKPGLHKKKIYFPHLKPNTFNIPKLSDKLPELKYRNYHKKEHSISSSSDPEPAVPESTATPTPEAPKLGDEEFEEITDFSDKENIKSPSEGTDATSDEDRIGLLFDSVSTLNKEETAVVPMDIARGQDNHPIFVNQNTLLVCEWDHEIYKELFSDSNKTWEKINELPNPELIKNRQKIIDKQKSSISLYDCLDNFNKPEVLGEHDLWFCPRCKDHKQATKTINLWSTGDILTIHLKRFQVARSFSDKIDVTIDFPIEGLDMTKYVHTENGDKLIYDLIAVDNHYGGLGGGHYTASVLNFRDSTWYYFNDGRVTKIEDAKEVITGAAYLLFYRKRSTQKFLGGEKVELLINEGMAEFEKALQINAKRFEVMKSEIERYEENEDTDGTSSAKKSRSPSDDTNIDPKKRLLSKDRMEENVI